jgi:AMP deaminase
MSKNACRNLCSGGLVNCHALQLPRLYNVYKEQGIIENFEQLLDNIFQPLFEVTKDPNSHPQLHLFLKNVSQALGLII